MKGRTLKRGSTWTAYWSTTDPASGKHRQHSVIDSWVAPHIGGLRLDQLSPAAAGRMVDELRSPTGSRHGRGALSVGASSSRRSA